MNSKHVSDYIGLPAMLEQTAEECTELAFACLKLARFLRDENKVHGHTKEELIDSLTEECADTFICIDELIHINAIDICEYSKVINAKLGRMAERMKKEFKDGGETMDA